MLRLVLALAVAMHSVSICLGACAEMASKEREPAKPSCCQKKEAAPREESSCCCKPTANHRSKPASEDCKCCISPDQPLGMPGAAAKIVAPAAIGILATNDCPAAGWAAITHFSFTTENWLMRQGASSSHSVLCVWIN